MSAFTAAQALEMAMQIERNGEAFYRAAITKASDPQVKALFADLALAEQKHFAIFREMAGHPGEALRTGDGVTAGDDYGSYVEAALDNALFGGPDKALAMAEQARDWRLALQAAIGFEKDTLLFFFDLRDLVGEEDRPTLSAIIGEEKGHLHRLASMLGERLATGGRSLAASR